ncbi:MAG: DUF1186 domain-containing protein [Rhodocyclaceae bacterium]|nr:DUF1186 domain-containing protein [Rhodocyclaceae bacterium]
MEWREVANTLSVLRPPFPRAAAEEARRRWNEWGPRFIAEIGRVADGGSLYHDDDGGEDEELDGLFSFAVYLAAEKRDSRAYRPLVRACHCDRDRADELFGDDVGETLGQILASVCDGDLAPLKALAEDTGATMWCRYAAIQAMVVRVVEGDGSRDDLLAWLDVCCEREAGVLRRGEWDYEREPIELLSWAADAACDIGPAPLLPKIRAWLAEDLIAPGITGLGFFEEKAALSVAACLADAAESEYNRYVTDGLDMTARWFCFEKEKPVEKRSIVDGWPKWGAQEPAAVVAPIVHRTTAKVGRNDPCPCGSGKKFKKCCDKADPPDEKDADSRAVARALDWLHTQYRKAATEAVEDFLTLGLDDEEADALRDIEANAWSMFGINASEWLLAEGEIEVKGRYRQVAELLLEPGGPMFTVAQRRWIEQLATRPLRLYEITDVLPGVQMTLCDAIDIEAPPVVVREQSGSRDVRIGTCIAVRLMDVDGHFELSGAVYPFSAFSVPGLLDDLRRQIVECERREDDMRRTVSFTIREHWRAQFVKPLPLPRIMDRQSGDPVLLVTDHYRVGDWDALARALEKEADVDGDRAAGWTRFIDCDDGLRRSITAINLGNAPDRIGLFYKTQAHADAGRPWFESLAGDAASFLAREISDPAGVIKNLPTGREAAAGHAPPSLPPEAMAEIIEKYLRGSYANWADEPIPALGDKTPRQAIATPAGLERVKGLLRSYEANENRMAAEQGRREISYGFLWEALGLRYPDG